MTLEKAYKIGTKYGFTFNGVGPSLSMVDNKVGICVNVLDNNFGYIRRNFVFDDQKDFEEFLKKYSYYIHNKDQEGLTLILNDYEKSSPDIIYSNEIDNKEKEQVEIKNKELLLEDMQSFLKNFISSLDKIRAFLTEKVLIEQDYYNKLKYYQELLYKAFDMEYSEQEMVASKEIIEEFNNELKEFDLAHKRDLASLDLNEVTMADLNNKYDQLFNECKNFIGNEKWIKEFSDETKFKNNTAVLNVMIDYLVKNPKANKNTEKDLDELKNDNTFESSYDADKSLYKEKYLDIYEGVTKDYNNALFNAPKVELTEYKKSSMKAPRKITELKDIYDALDEEQKKSIRLIHSPLKPLILYIIEQAYIKNKRFNFDKNEFVKIYDVMASCFKNSENLVFKLKYFKNLEMSSYEEFVKSVVKISKSICKSFTKLPYDIKLYSLNYDSCMISASDSNIKNGSDTINIIFAKEGCSYIYSPIKIVYDKDSYLLSIIPNDNVIFFPRYLNTSKKENAIVSLNLYEEGYGIEKLKDNNLLIITKFDLDKTIKYKFSTMTGK